MNHWRASENAAAKTPWNIAGGFSRACVIAAKRH
jgi:hypothetical protein